MMSKMMMDKSRTKIIDACDTMVIRFQLHIQYNRKYQKRVLKRGVNGPYIIFINCWLKMTSYKKVLSIMLQQMYMDKFTPTHYREIPINLDDYPKPKSVTAVPILGSLKSMRGNKCPFIQFSILSKEYGDIYAIKMGNKNGIVVNNLDIIREILNENGKYFGGRPDFLRFHALFGGDRNNSLALCDWSTLQQRRRNLARKFCSPRETTSHFSSLNDIGMNEIKTFLNHLDETVECGTSVNLKTYIQQCCANMFMGYMCSKRFDYNNREFQQTVKDFDKIFWEINQGYALDFIPLTQPYFVSHLAKIVQWAQRIRYFILKEIVLDRVEAHSNNETNYEEQSDFTKALLDQMGDGIDPNAIIYMLEDFIGGHSAIGNLITMMLAFIVKQPEVGDRIYSEIIAVTENGANEITLYDMERMPYTMATMNETLRYQSSPIVPHVATENVVISGYGIKAGTIVFINNYMLNRGEDYWDAPDKFDPNRFLETVAMKRKRSGDNYEKDSSMVVGNDGGPHQYNNANNNVNNKPVTDGCPFNKNNDSMNKIENNNNNNNNKPTSGCPFTNRSNTDEVPVNDDMVNAGDDDDIEYVTRVKKNIPHFLPFSIGKRTCIGQNLVRSYTFLILTNLLQKYRITCADPKTIQMNDACVALPTDTFKLILNLR